MHTQHNHNVVDIPILTGTLKSVTDSKTYYSITNLIVDSNFKTNLIHRGLKMTNRLSEDVMK